MEAQKDIIIIGGGPAGLTAAQYSARGNLKTLLLEEMGTGGQVLVINDLENYPGFRDPVNGMQLSQDMEAQALKFGAEIVSTSVSRVYKKGNMFHVETDSGELTSYAVIVATGAKHKKLGVPGEDEFSGRGVSYCATCDGPFFKNRKILVIGGGDAACDEATYLSKLTDKVVMIHRRERFRAQKALADRVAKNKNIEIRFNTECREIRGTAKVEKVLLETADGKKYEEDFDAVFVFIGSIPQTKVLPVDLPKDEAGYVIADCNMETRIRGLFVAGDVRATPFRQIIVACGDGAIAAHSAALLIDELKGQAYN